MTSMSYNIMVRVKILLQNITTIPESESHILIGPKWPWLTSETWYLYSGFYVLPMQIFDLCKFLDILLHLLSLT